MIVCLDVGEVLVDETRVWSVWGQVLGVSPFELHAAIGARLATGGTHLDALGDVDPDWRDRRGAFERALGGLQPRDLYPDALPSIRRLQRAGVRVAVCGNQPVSRRAELLAAGVRADPLLTSDDLGAEKPDQAFFQGVLDALGEPEPGDVWYVGDRPDNDVGPALEAGLHSVWLRRGPWARIVPAGGSDADLIVDDLAGLVDVLLDRGRDSGR